jgi:hypothetical protein
MQRRQMVVLLASAAIGGSNALQASSIGEQGQSAQDHVSWVAEVMKRMDTIKPGMTGKELLTIFSIEGGIYNSMRPTVVSRNCPYFKMDVELQAINRPSRDENGRTAQVENDDDIILKVSTPYLQSMIID